MDKLSWVRPALVGVIALVASAGYALEPSASVRTVQAMKAVASGEVTEVSAFATRAGIADMKEAQTLFDRIAAVKGKTGGPDWNTLEKLAELNKLTTDQLTSKVLKGYQVSLDNHKAPEAPKQREEATSFVKSADDLENRLTGDAKTAYAKALAETTGPGALNAKKLLGQLVELQNTTNCSDPTSSLCQAGNLALVDVAKAHTLERGEGAFTFGKTVIDGSLAGQAAAIATKNQMFKGWGKGSMDCSNESPTTTKRPICQCIYNTRLADAGTTVSSVPTK